MWYDWSRGFQVDHQATRGHCGVCVFSDFSGFGPGPYLCSDESPCLRMKFNVFGKSLKDSREVDRAWKTGGSMGLIKSVVEEIFIMAIVGIASGFN